MIRTGNEDAFALLHNCESRQDDVAESALLLLADGMGGYEAGEVAAVLALAALRKNLTAQKPFAALAGAAAFTSDLPQGENNTPLRAEVDDDGGGTHRPRRRGATCHCHCPCCGPDGAAWSEPPGRMQAGAVQATAAAQGFAIDSERAGPPSRRSRR